MIGKTNFLDALDCQIKEPIKEHFKEILREVMAKCSNKFSLMNRFQDFFRESTMELRTAVEEIKQSIA